MKKLLIITILLSLVSELALAAPGPINFGAVRFVKRLNASPTYPIDLYESTAGAGLDHNNHYFVARTLFHLGPNNTLSDYEQKKLRNEICASDKLYTAGANAGTENIPGSLGVYEVNNSIVSVTNTGMAGERLDAVLRKLAKEDDVTKAATGLYYAKAMTQALGYIHAGNITWGNLNLHNFFVRPDGGVYAVDLSDAKSAPAGDGDAARNAEVQDLAQRVIKDMYNILFPAPNDAFAEYRAVINAVPANLAALQGILPNIDADVADDANIPYQSFPARFVSIVKAEHDANAADQMKIGAALINNNNNDILKRPDGTPYVDKAAYCLGWTGNE